MKAGELGVLAQDFARKKEITNRRDRMKNRSQQRFDGKILSAFHPKSFVEGALWAFEQLTNEKSKTKL